jgi:hypothetical protein
MGDLVPFVCIDPSDQHGPQVASRRAVVPLARHRLGNGWLTRRRWRFSGERRDRCTQGCIGRQHTMVAVAVQVRRRDEGGEPVDELQRCER